MLRPALALSALLALPAAHAADLDLTVSSDGVGPVTLTLKDVKPGALPSVELPGTDRRTMRVDMTLSESTLDDAPAYDLALTITKRTPMGRKKVHEEVSRPVVRVKPNELAQVSAGGRAPIAGTDPVEMQDLNFFKVQMMVRTEEVAP